MDGLLIIGHGTRGPAGNAQALAVAAQVAARSGVPALATGFLDHAAPSVPDAVDRLAAAGCRRIGVLPLIMFAAGHSRRDIPELLAAAERRHPGLRFRTAALLGLEPALISSAAAEVAAATARADREAGPVSAAATAVLLVGRGSSDPGANADLYKAARLLWEASGLGTVECAFAGVTAPDVAAGLDRCRRLGARRVILLPWFLFRGLLMDRLRQPAIGWQSERAPLQVGFAGGDGLGSAPAVLELLLSRVKELEGELV